MSVSLQILFLLKHRHYHTEFYSRLRENWPYHPRWNCTLLSAAATSRASLAFLGEAQSELRVTLIRPGWTTSRFNTSVHVNKVTYPTSKIHTTLYYMPSYYMSHAICNLTHRQRILHMYTNKNVPKLFCIHLYLNLRLQKNFMCVRQRAVISQEAPTQHVQMPRPWWLHKYIK